MKLVSEFPVGRYAFGVILCQSEGNFAWGFVLSNESFGDFRSHFLSDVSQFEFT